MRRQWPVALALLVLTGCAGSPGAEVAATAPVEAPAGEVEVLQGTVTGVAEAGDRVEVHVRVAWAPVLRAEDRTLEVHIGPVTRFVPAALRTGLHEGDEVQVSVPAGDSDRLHASEIAVLDID